MRLLLDECVPRPLRRELPGHEVRTVGELGWAGKRNSELLALMVAERFEGFLTVDQNLEFQQNVSASGLAVVVIVARTNRLKELRPLVPATLEALGRVQPGECARRAAVRGSPPPRVASGRRAAPGLLAGRRLSRGRAGAAERPGQPPAA